MAFLYPITKVYDQIKLSIMHELLPWRTLVLIPCLLKFSLAFHMLVLVNCLPMYIVSLIAQVLLNLAVNYNVK
jgi:hypothetical protein